MILGDKPLISEVVLSQVLGDSTGLGLEGASIALVLGVILMGEVFWGLEAFTELGELLVPL
jgi:hypothetical protein